MVTSATRWIIALATIAASFAITGCGDDDDGSEPTRSDLAALVPPDAVLYADAVVRPADEQRENVESALATVLGEDDPGAYLIDQLEQDLGEDGFEISYDEDVEPWLGERAAAFFLSFTEDADGAVVIETTDEELAQESIERLAEKEGRVRSETYEGVDYFSTDANSATGLVDGHVVAGSRVGFEAAVDASTGDSLADSDAYAEALDSAAEDSLVTVYAEPRSVLDVVVESGELPEADASAIADAIGPSVDAPVVLSAGADENGFFAELAAQGEAPVGGGTDLIERIPDDAWVAFGLSDAGALVAPALTGALASNEVLARVLDRLQGDTGLEEFAASVGDAAGWFGGSNVLTSTGGLIFETSDEAAASELLDRLQAGFEADPALTLRPGDLDGEAFSVGPSDVPIEFPMVVRDGLLVTGLGEQSVEQVYEPESSLTDADAYETGQDALGDDFSTSLLIDFQALVGFFEGLNVADEPDLAEALPYMARLDVFAAGAREENDSTTVRFILRPQEE